MATIRIRKNKGGSVMYTAQIRIKRDEVQVYQESASFSRREVAKTRERRRETELSEPGAIERGPRAVGITVVKMFDRYMDE